MLLLPPLAIGAAILVLQLRTADVPAPGALQETAVAVAVAVAERREVTPRAVGFGRVEPSRTFVATAETAGRVVERHPQLERGRLLPAGTVLLRLDDADLRLAKLRVEAEIERLDAEVQRIAVRADNLRRSLEIEQRAVALASVELERQRSLLQRGSSSGTAVDEAETAYLSRLDREQSLQASLAEIEPELAVRRAERSVLEAEHAQVVLDLERTQVVLGFRARVADVAVDVGQFVAKGQTLAELDAVDHVEIDAQFALAQLRPLVAGATEPLPLDAAAWRDLPARLGIEATVRLRERDVDVSWPARFDRPSDRVDPQTRTLGLMIIVDDPYGQVVPGRRPPLTKNMHVEVVLEGAPQPDRLVVPLAAVRGEASEASVLVVDADDRLRRRPVTVAARLADLAVVERGLEAGERVVVGPLAPAIEGMRLIPVPVPAAGDAPRISDVRS